MAGYRKRPTYKKKKHAAAGAPIERVRLPKKEEGEMFGMVEERLAGTKLRAMCDDGEIRLIRIPGKLRKRVWVRVGDIIVLVPWEFDNAKADLKWRYYKGQVEWLQQRGYLKGLY